MATLNKSISFNVSNKDKKRIFFKAQQLGIPVARMIRNVVLEKYEDLNIGYVSYDSTSPIKHDIDIRRLKPPKHSKPMTKEAISMRACMNELKEVFSQGLNVLGKMEDSELGIKTHEELKISQEESIDRMIERQRNQK
jgi:hypothetical protein